VGVVVRTDFAALSLGFAAALGLALPEADCFRAEGVLTVFADAAADLADFTGEDEVSAGFAVFGVALAARWALVVFFVDMVISSFGL
jgi:hypothetical protein